jgi:hypothetical protein
VKAEFRGSDSRRLAVDIHPSGVRDHVDFDVPSPIGAYDG